MTRDLHRADYYVGSKWGQWAILFIVIGLFVLGLLSALSNVKRRGERQAVDLTVRNMRSGLQMAVGEAMMQQRDREIAEWVGSNPVLWLSDRPNGYRGECDGSPPRRLNHGEWCFGSDAQALFYRPHAETSLRDEKTGAMTPCSVLQWRVARVSSQTGAVREGLVGLRIEAATSCRWSDALGN